jgi:hypothetical protein
MLDVFLPLKFVDNRSELGLIFEFKLILVFGAFFGFLRCFIGVLGQK